MEGLVLTTDDVKALGSLTAMRKTSKHAAIARLFGKLLFEAQGKDADKDSSGLISAKELYKAIIQGEARETMKQT